VPRAGATLAAHEQTVGLGGRIRRAATFIAIVWGVAATFIAFEVISLRAMDVMLSHPGLFGRVLLSRATQESTACLVGPAERPARESADAASGQGRFGAWLIGLSLGREAAARQFAASDGRALASIAAQRDQFAQMLGVPPPPVFVPRNPANALAEFLEFVEHDEGKTAHRLAVQYAPEACHLYKLGALWGYSMLMRPLLRGGRTAFAVEIHHYSRQIALPPSLWQPMIERTDPAASQAQIQSETAALTSGLTAHLMPQP
jgi:hypothetical protein